MEFFFLLHLLQVALVLLKFKISIIFFNCLKGLQTGDISLVIGTHSLIAENVEFSALRIAVVDEQHRFGVVQRGLFNGKVIFLWNGIVACVCFCVDY